ncbi:hypothetical protein RDI58_009314 [Solanum bulbocastanum]|uniref:Uncharacterized protein n=1 Tax=Solanum bulbocastanum TaxID=147425 RepID=A0AAN8TZW2_SOLBU
MGKRGRARKDEAQKNTSVGGATPSQESQQQEAVASLRSGRVLRMKQEPKLTMVQLYRRHWVLRHQILHLPIPGIKLECH